MNRRSRQAGLVREHTPKKPAAVRRHPRPWNRIDDEEMVLYLCDSVRKLLKKPGKKPTSST